MHAVPSRIGCDPSVVEHHREHRDGLSDRLAQAAGGREFADERGDIGSGDLVDVAAMEGRRTPERRTLVGGRRRRDVDA
jgi:hypothetical protein